MIKRPVILKNLLLLSCLILYSFTTQLEPLYFSGPEESVKIITQLLRTEDWATLSAYYHIPDQDQQLLDSLLSGDYFIRKERPEAAHPAGFWRYRHPFSPGFSYSWHETIKEDLIKVHLVIEIDQGQGMIQTGMDSFLLIKFKEGYKLLPEE